MAKTEKGSGVLILVLVEDGLGERRLTLLSAGFNGVLILVLVEDGLGGLSAGFNGEDGEGS